MFEILLADDHAIVRAGLREALENIPQIEIVGEVGDGTALEESLARLQPDLLVVDVAMPEFEPIAAVQRIKIRYPELKILVVSAYDDEAYVVGLLHAGVDGYHLKDQPLSDLQLAIQRVLSGERWILQSIDRPDCPPSPRVSRTSPPGSHPPSMGLAADAHAGMR
jgi:DNA-binding NarL/FixJ family response regulator